MWILDSEGDLLDGMRFLHYRSVSYVLTIFEESASGCDLGRSISLVGQGKMAVLSPFPPPQLYCTNRPFLSPTCHTTQLDIAKAHGDRSLFR